MCTSVLLVTAAYISIHPVPLLTSVRLIRGPHTSVFLHFDLSEGANYRMTSAALLATHRPPPHAPRTPNHYISKYHSGWKARTLNRLTLITQVTAESGRRGNENKVFIIG